MKVSSLRLYIEEALKSLFRNGLMTVTSIFTVTACMFIVTVSYILAINLDYSLKQLEGTVGLSVTIKQEASTDTLNALREKILEIPHVETVDYVDADTALVQYAESFGEYADMVLSFRNNNPLPRSFVIHLDDTKYQPQVIDTLMAQDYSDAGIKTVRHAKQATEMLIGVNNVIRIISISMIILLAFLSVVIIMNTVKLTVNNRKNEIFIMKYVGATDMFIRAPFVIEGIIIGLVGAAIPIVLCWIGYTPAINAFYGYSPLLLELVKFQTAVKLFPLFVPLGILLGAFIGSLGSIVSVTRYLDV